MSETARHRAKRRGESKPDSALTSRSLLSFLVAFLLACGDGQATAPAAPTQPAPAPVPTSMVITPSSATLAALAQTVQLTATVQDQDGRNMAGIAVNWASSDGGVATVDAEGLVTAVRNGATSVTATVRGGGPSASAAVTVSQQATEMRLSPVPEVFRAFGETLQLTAEVLDANGNAVVDAAVEWSSSDPSVVVVDNGGLVTAIGNGKASVSAASRSTRADAEFVVEQEAATMSVSPAADTLSPLADTLQLRAEALDANGHLVGTARFTWSSSDETVAAVNASGLVTTEGQGSVEITAAAHRADLTATATLLVVLRERDILERFYVAANGSNWKNSENWLTDAPLGSWYGVRTDSRSGSVVQLELSDNGLSGSIPASLGYLVELVNLDLRDNQLTGSLPPELGNLSNLVYLNLINNSVAGSIPPELGRLTGLLNLWLDQNALSGAIPPELGDLGSLRQLRLGYNNLTGSIPPELGELSSLISLYLPGNGLTGAIPPELGNLPLSFLALHSNRLTGPIPTELTRARELRQLWLWENELSGTIPPGLGRLDNLRDLLLRENALVGAIPPEFAELTQLRQLSLSDNHLTGPIPPGLGRLRNLETLWLGGNSLGGTIPSELGDLTQLRQMYLSGAGLTGPIPRELGNLSQLEELRLASNRLTGEVPSEFGKLTRLRNLHLMLNPLSGPLPQELTAVPLRNFYWGGTRLCAPANQAFQTWLDSIEHGSRGATCPP